MHPELMPPKHFRLPTHQWMEDLTSKQLNGLNILQVKGHVCFPMTMLLNLAGFPIFVFGCFHTRSKYRYHQ
jgi:hypothetical protein